MLSLLIAALASHLAGAPSISARPRGHAPADSASLAPAVRRPTHAARPGTRRAAATRVGAADSLVLEKGEHRLTLYAHGQPLRTYLVALGTSPVGDKVRAGDHRTPEGIFTIDARNARSRYHLGLHVSYPDAAHRERARSLGVSPGGDIMIHGLPNGKGFVGAAHREDDWTNGCIAVTDEEIEEIWDLVADGARIEIRP